MNSETTFVMASPFSSFLNPFSVFQPRFPVRQLRNGVLVFKTIFFSAGKSHDLLYDLAESVRKKK
jgi:hypothetical protein